MKMYASDTNHVENIFKLGISDTLDEIYRAENFNRFEDRNEQKLRVCKEYLHLYNDFHKWLNEAIFDYLELEVTHSYDVPDL